MGSPRVAAGMQKVLPKCLLLSVLFHLPVIWHGSLALSFSRNRTGLF